MEPKTKPAQKWVVPALLAVIIALLAALLFMRSCQAAPADTDVADNATPKLGYAEGLVVTDEDALQAAVDAMNEKAGESIGLRFQNSALSTDGINFDCFISNAARNEFDMYLQIFADEDLTDELYLSGLVRPGEAFQELTLNHALDTGKHTVYVAFTQVEEDLATIHAQVMFTMEFIVQN